MKRVVSDFSPTVLLTLKIKYDTKNIIHVFLIRNIFDKKISLKKLLKNNLRKSPASNS